MKTVENLVFSHETAIRQGRVRIFKNKKGHELAFLSTIEDKTALDLVGRWYADWRSLEESLSEYESEMLEMKHWNCNSCSFHLWNASLSKLIDFSTA